MKDLITSVASLLLLSIFILQFSGNQVLHNRMFRADMAVESFRDAARVQGYISQENTDLLVDALSKICGCSASEITVDSWDDSGNSIGELIHYRIRYPLKNLVAAGGMLGIAEDENRAWFEEEGWVVSVYEEPDCDSGDSPADDDGDAL